MIDKVDAELLISRLKQWDLLDDSVRITSQRKRLLGVLHIQGWVMLLP